MRVFHFLESTRKAVKLYELKKGNNSANISITSFQFGIDDSGVDYETFSFVAIVSRSRIFFAV